MLKLLVPLAGAPLHGLECLAGGAAAEQHCAQQRVHARRGFASLQWVLEPCIPAMRALPAGLLKQGGLQGVWGEVLPEYGLGVLAAQADSDAAG